MSGTDNAVDPTLWPRHADRLLLDTLEDRQIATKFRNPAHEHAVTPENLNPGPSCLESIVELATCKP